MDYSALLLGSLLGLTSPAETVSTYELSAITGLWALESADSCQERYNFGRDGKLTTVSGAERTHGKYRFAYVETSPLPALAMHTTYDNNAPDCTGTQLDQTGNSSAVFVKLNHRHSPTRMQWCSDPLGNDCPATLYRLLP